MPSATYRNTSSATMLNRQRAYRRLLLTRAAASRSGVIEFCERIAFGSGSSMAAERPQCRVPVVRLKIGEPLVNTKRGGQSVAELNNLRASYSHYCHYRVGAGAKPQFPPLSSSASSSMGGSRAPSPTRDATVIFMLRGTHRRSRSPRKNSVTTTPPPPPASTKTPTGQVSNHSESNMARTGSGSMDVGNGTPQNYSGGHLIVKRKDISATALAASSQTLVDVVAAPQTSTSTSVDGVDGYELRGNSLFKSNMSEARDDDNRDPSTVTAVGSAVAGVGAHRSGGTSAFVVRQSAGRSSRVTPGSQRFMPRPGSYVPARRSRDNFSYDNERSRMLYDNRRCYHGESAAGGGRGSISGGRGAMNHSRRVRFNDDRLTANVNTYIFPPDERHRLRSSGANQQPLQLTQKNLEIFDYLHNPRNEFGHPPAQPVTALPEEHADGQVDKRVLDWVHERQLDMTLLLQEEQEVVSEGPNQRLVPTPDERDEEADLRDLEPEDPDLEVYDLTHEDDFHSQDEVIDKVIEDMSVE